MRAPLLVLTLLSACPKAAAPPSTSDMPTSAMPALVYPLAAKGDVVDDYHGTQVPDPYRWLEDPDAPETRTWIDAENRLTQAWLAAIPQRDDIHRRLNELWNFEKFGTPFKEGGHYFYSRNDGLQDQSVYYVTDSLDGEARVLIDPNTLSADGTVALAGLSVSEDGRYVAWATSDGGSDWSTWHIRDVQTGQDLPDLLKWTKFTDVSWTHDGGGFFYSRYPETENPLEQVNEDNKVYYHRLGTEQAVDLLVYETPEQPRWGFGAEVSEDGAFLVVNISETTEQKNRLYYQRLVTGPKDFDPAAGEMVHLLDDNDAAYWYLGNQGDRFWFFTNLDAPRGRVIAIDLGKPARDDWEEIVPQSGETLESASIVGGRLIAQYLSDAHTVVRTFDLAGAASGEVAMPGLGTANGFGGKMDDPETFFGFTSFTSPTTLFRLDTSTGEVTLFKKPDVRFDPDDFETKQIFYESKDGTKVPMFITYKKGIELDGERPTLLYGYGGFNASITPWFRVSALTWMEMGGVYASANIRGGGEYGEDWHQAGTLANKQNVFDDFIAAGEWLVANGYTRPEKLAIEGGSNGGLLVGACEVQRPDLFGAALPAVGVMDMLRYHLFTIGWAWASDYGTSDDAQMFPILYGYSPYYALRPGVRYPATLVTTGDHDDRVVTAHSFKFAARLQEMHQGENPVLIRIETRAGHGRGKSTSMYIDEAADKLAFLVQALGVEGTVPAPFQ